MKARKPMTFDIDRRPRTTFGDAEKSRPAKDRQQVGARIPTMLYRELKAKAGLEGVTVQDLVEQAIRQFMSGTNTKS